MKLVGKAIGSYIIYYIKETYSPVISAPRIPKSRIPWPLITFRDLIASYSVTALNVMGFIAGAASLVPYLTNLLAPNPADATTIRLVVGSAINGTGQFDGNTPGVALWTFRGQAIGYTDGKGVVVKGVNFVDITVNPIPEVGNIQDEYLSITNDGNDAICIAGLGVSFPDGAHAGFSTNLAYGIDALS